MGFDPTRARSSRAGASRRTMRRRSIGRTTGCYPEDAGSTPAVAATRPGLLADRGCRSLTSVARVRIPLGALSSPSLALGRVWECGPAVSRVRRVRFPSRAPSRRSSTGRALRSYRGEMGVQILPARLRRKASSEPAGCEPVEQGAIPWRRLNDDGPAGAGTALIWRNSVVRFHGRRFPDAAQGRVRGLWSKGSWHPAGFGNRNRRFDSCRPDCLLAHLRRDARWRSGISRAS